MSVHALKPWTELVKLHPDVESGNLTEAVFAIDLGAVAAGDPATPLVYRDPDAFFAATYVTTDLYRLLEEVLASLAGRGNYNRVLKLRSPFGGGKSHVLAALLHAARSRKSLNQIPACRDLADPGPVAVAVFDGEKFTATGDKDVGSGQRVHTMWGWLAWQLGPSAYQVVAKHDRDRVSPAGDEIKAMFEATGKPVLLLLDEVLKYMERAAAVTVGESTLQRQAMDFIQNLTVEVANSTNAVMVYSLQWSAREALGNVALLEQLDKLTSRKDQVREPVTGDEILAVVKRRLLGAEPPAEAAQQVAAEYTEVVKSYWRVRAETPSAKQDAEEQSLQLRRRMQAAYPFHPALIDVMNSRWTSVDGFQRTRGALRFLASCLHALKRSGGAQPILGPAEIPLSDAEVRRAMLKDLDPREDYSPVIMHDLVGPNARAKRIDDRLAKERPALAGVRPALRLATAILAYSFGGLRREEGSDVLPPGVTETELLAACLGPDLDSITASAVLGELRNSCLYLHYDGVRYCFKKDPNVTKLIEDAEQEVARDPDAIREQIKEMLQQRLAGKAEAIVWPATSQDLPDREPQFLVGYLPLEFAYLSSEEQDQRAVELLTTCGARPRQYRNGIALAVPDKKPIESLRRAVRYLMAVERVESKKKQHRLTKDQEEQLKERRRTEEAAAETAFRQLYSAVWLPRVGSGGALELERVEVGGRPLQATGVHERVMELLTAVGTPKIHNTLHPRKIVERMKLGQSLAPGEPPRLGVATKEVQDAFFAFLEPPRIISDAVLRKAIVRGVAEKMFAYTTGSPCLGGDGKYQVAMARVAFDRTMSEDEVDLEEGFLMVPEAMPVRVSAPSAPVAPGAVLNVVPAEDASGGETIVGSQPVVGPQVGARAVQVRTNIRIAMRATRDQVFKAFPAIANLADSSDEGKVRIVVEGQRAGGYDANWFRNAVEEPLDEANIEGLEIE
ncbi:MAG: ATP-binding protein [Armatimonadota bacterium]